MQKVAIVNAGEWGRGGYDLIVGGLERMLREENPGTQVLVVHSTQEALYWVGTGIGCIVYITRVMLREAKKVAAEHPDIRVVLFTDLLPEGEVVFVKRGCVPAAYMRDVILV